MHQLSYSCVESLIEPVLKDEINSVIFCMKSYKTLGHNGFQPILFKHFRETICDDICHFLLTDSNKDYINVLIADALIIIILKDIKSLVG